MCNICKLKKYMNLKYYIQWNEIIREEMWMEKKKYLLHWEVAVCLKMYLNVFINHILSNFK